MAGVKGQSVTYNGITHITNKYLKSISFGLRGNRLPRHEECLAMTRGPAAFSNEGCSHITRHCEAKPRPSVGAVAIC